MRRDDGMKTLWQSSPEVVRKRGVTIMSFTRIKYLMHDVVMKESSGF